MQFDGFVIVTITSGLSTGVCLCHGSDASLIISIILTLVSSESLFTGNISDRISL